MKITNNFSLEEFECKCGCKMPEFVKKNIIELAENLQAIRDVVGKLNLTNAYRCKEHNADVGGATNSQHLKGKAADVKSKEYDVLELSKIIEGLIKSEKIEQGGIGIYNTFTHYDIRGVRARWSKTITK
jgi:uncharacterized protein YcbK (DUF882 family)